MKKINWATVGVWILVVASLASVSLSVYSYVSMPSKIAEYINQHKSELKGEKGDKGDNGQDAPARPYVSPFGNQWN